MISHKNLGFVVFGLLVLALGAVPSSSQAAELAVNNGADGCYVLYAGQTIDAGEVCFSVDGTNLKVTYTTYGGWELTEAHLWVGEVQDNYPKAKNGNPKIGNFPYNSGDITGATSHSFSVPLGSVQEFIVMDDLDQYCPDGISGTIYAMAHAALRKDNGTGGYQTETGWSDGEGAVKRGSWATRSAITLSVICDSEPPPPPTTGQETAIMFGNITLNDDTDGICDGVYNGERWGWQAGPLTVGTYQYDIYAAAGNNVLENGTIVGYVDIDVHDYGNVTVTPVLYEGFTAEETHIYIGTEPVCSGAFGKDWDENGSTDIDTSGGVYVGVHFSVLAECGVNPDSPDNFCEPAK